MAEQQTTVVAGLRLLVAEDEAFQLKVISRLLADLGAAEVLTAGDGAEALARLEQVGGAIDALICDLEMPGLDGLGVIAAVRARPEPARRALPIVILSAHRIASVVEQARAAGADGFLVKPVTRAALSAELAAALARRARPEPA